MTSLISPLPITNAVEALGWTLLHFVWQGAAVALLLWIVLRLARNHKPQVRYLAGCAALALMCGAALATLVMEMQAVKQEMAGSSKRVAGTLPEVTQNSLLAGTSAPEHQAASGTFARVSTSVFESASSTATATVPAAIQNAPSGFALLKSLPQAVARMAGRVEPYLPWIVCLWAVGVAFFSLRLLAGWSAVRELRVAADATDTLWIGRFNQLKTRLAVSYAVRLVFSTSAAVPMVIGWLKPVVLVPAGLVAGLSPAQLEAILAHELIHIRRHDYLVNLVQNVVETVFFYHPAVAWVSGRIRIEREHCCDDAASLACGGTLDYARALAALAELRRGPALGVAATGGSLVERIRRLAGSSADRRASTLPAALFLLLAPLFVLAIVMGVGLAQRARAATGAASSPAKAGDVKPPSPRKSRKENGSEKERAVTIRGRVLGPAGRPAAATVSVVRFDWKSGDRVRWELLKSQPSDGRGEFALTLPSSQLPPKREVMVVAEASGFGLDWTWWGDLKPVPPLVLKLVPDFPIRGRILDLEGKPVAGVTARVLTLRASHEAGLDGWLGDMKAGAYSWVAGEKLGAFIKGFPGRNGGVATTDREGRFVLPGLGAERVVELGLQGETIAYKRMTVATRDIEPIIRSDKAGVGGRGVEVYGASFTRAAQPTRPIVGTVRDAATGAPLSGVSIESWHFAGESPSGERDLKTASDAQGHFRLVGMPGGKGNVLFAVPNDEQPYFMRRLDVPASDGFAPVTVDFDLHRGLWITGRVTDKETGKPISSRINYWPFRTNPFPKQLPEFGPNYAMQGDYWRYETRPDGTFRVPGLPGRGIVGALAMEGNYRSGAGAEAIKGLDGEGRFETYRNEMVPSLKWPTAVREINPTEGTAAVTCDLAYDHGETVKVTVLDPQGKPVAGCKTSLATRGGKWTGVDSPFELNNLTLGKKQPLLIEQKDRGLAKFVLVSVEARTPRSLTVTLEPSMTLAGRVVDAEGIPYHGVVVQALLRGMGDFWPTLPSVVCQRDGTFKYPGLAAGDTYSLIFQGAEIEFARMGPSKIKVVPGKTVDLGDIKLKRLP